MLNREIYQTDPSTRKLVNEGVVTVNDEITKEALDVLRYELDTFVCDGQYEKGLAHILESYLKNLDQAQQPAVWVSGFYGSGKSHLVKMLRALWIDTKFPDGASARGIAHLPNNIKELLKELSTQSRRFGGIHAASGTLGAGAHGSVRLALLRIIFKSVGLPEQYHVAKFVMWLKSENILEQVRDLVEKNGRKWDEELDNFYVAEGLHDALLKIKPNLFSSSSICVETLNNLYPYVQDISSDDMIKAIRQALTLEDKFPLTLIVLDEIQVYIGEDSQRSMEVQEVVESCCKNIGSKLLFIGTGQTAVTGTSNLKKLEGRFTIRIELSDSDVDTVVRKVVLAKKASSLPEIEKMMQKNSGEISRHLTNTNLGHRLDDLATFNQDYPILPVRRRFWEHTLRSLDPTGTDSQLRNQLSMVHKAIQSNLDYELGSVIQADYTYFDSADKLLQSRILPRKVYEKTMSWMKGTEEEQLLSRACGLIFLINKLASSNKDLGLKATVDTIADLMVTNLPKGSSELRNKLPGLLDDCELLIKVDDEYRIQTEESAAWNNEFLSQRSQLLNETHRIEAERDDRIRTRFADTIKKISIIHGNSKVSRDIFPIFLSQLPNDCNQKIYIWVRDGWSIDETSVRADARQAGNQSPTVFVYIPKRSADEIRRNIIDFKAANTTLEIRGLPNTSEGNEARAAIETIRSTADKKIIEHIDEALSGARVYQGGGNEIVALNLKNMIEEAAMNSLQRLFPQFNISDHPGWDKVYSQAKQGAPDALKAIGFKDEPIRHPVCKAILSYIGSGKKGIDIRNYFENAPFGWSRDSIDGGLQILLISGYIRAHDEFYKNINPKELERKFIGKAMFKIESEPPKTEQLIQIRKLYLKIGCPPKPGDDLATVPEFLSKMEILADTAGGDPPLPQRPDTKFLEEIRSSSGNEQLILIYNKREEITKFIDDWHSLAEKITKRLPSWASLKNLILKADKIKDLEVIQAQFQQIEQQRLLLADPNQIEPLVDSVAQKIRESLKSLEKEYLSQYDLGIRRLHSDINWMQLEKEQQQSLLKQYDLTEDNHPKINVQSTEEILNILEQMSLAMFSDRVAALPGRFKNVLKKAAEKIEPKAQFPKLPSRTLKTEKDIDEWIKEVQEKLKLALKDGPIVIQ